jgi:hypothetical protein
MAKRGKKFTFHGAFGSKKKAIAKERRTKGAFIRKIKIKRKARWLVLTKKR